MNADRERNSSPQGTHCRGCPTGRRGDTERAASPQAPGGQSVDWDAVHSAIQAILSGTQIAVDERGLPIRVHSGRAAGSAFALFSYRTFALQEDEQDPVVVGITFVAESDEVRVSADISREETGEILYALGPQQVPASPAAVLAAAENAAAGLAAQVAVVGATLADGLQQRFGQELGSGGE